MKKLVQLTLCVTLALSLIHRPISAQGPAPSKPNILLVLFDDVGFMDLGVYGSDTRTPNIDALARSGVMLSRYHTSPMCGPSRAMLMTGKDNHQVGIGTLMETVTDELRALPGYSMLWDAKLPTVASLLSQGGYQTYVTGKWGIGETGANLPNRFGFDRSYVMDATGGSNYDMTPYLPGYDNVHWYEDGKPITLPKDYYSSRSLVDKMIQYVDAGKADKPFFAFLSLQAAHMPVQVPAKYIDAYNGVFDAGWDVMREQRLKRAIELGLVPPTTKLAPAPKTHRVWKNMTPEQRAVAAREMQVNAGMMTAADEHVGRLLAHLRATGKLENTIVIVTSDNGAEGARTDFEGFQNLVVDGIKWIENFDTSKENLGQPRSLTAIGPEWASVSSAPFHLYKFYGGEGGIRVPLIVSGPGVKASGIVDTSVHVTDLLPTILEAAKVTYDADSFYGRSIFPVLAGQAASSSVADRGFGFEVSGNGVLYRGKWKITRNARPLGDAKWRLYDLSVDPGETTDVSANNRAVFESMLAEYNAYSKQVGVHELSPEDSAFDQLAKNLAAKALHKYWPYLLGLFAAIAAVLFLTYRTARNLMRRAAV